VVAETTRSLIMLAATITVLDVEKFQQVS